MRLLQLLEQRIDELQEIGDPSLMNRQQLTDELLSNGWAQVGDEDTAYSDVYGKSGTPWVVKILRVSRKGETSERFQCAMQWYRYCLQNWQSNPHLPRIPFVKTLKETKTTGQRSYVVMIELLEEFDVSSYEWRREEPVDNAIMWSVMASVAGLYDNRWYDQADLEKAFTTLLRLLSEEEILSLVNKYGERFYDEFGGGQSEQGSDGWYESLTNTMLATGGFMEISLLMEQGMKIAAERGNKMAIAMKQVHESGCEVDMHIGNVMVRPSTNELVVTDPVQG